MDIVFLGTGSGIPSKERNHPAIFMRYGEDSMLFDCGEGTQRQMMIAKTSFMKLDRIFITHWHADHFAGLIGLMQSMNLEGRTRPLSIYGPEADMFVEDILELGYWGMKFEVVAEPVQFEGSDISEIAGTEEYVIKSIPVKHTVPAVAYCFHERDRWNVDLKRATRYGLRQGPTIGKLKDEGSIIFKGKKIKLEDVAELRKGLKVVYTGDTLPCDNVAKLAQGADVLIHDATFVEEPENKAHTGAREAAEIAKRAGVKRLILTHLSRRYKTEEETLAAAKNVFADSEVAHDFMRIALKR